MTVHVIKIVDGTEIIGRIPRDQRRSDEVIRVVEPLEIRYRESPLGGASAILVKYNYFGEENSIEVFKTSIVCVYLATPEYSRTYEDSLKTIEDQMKAKKDTGFETKKSSDLQKVYDTLVESLTGLTGNNTIH